MHLAEASRAVSSLQVGARCSAPTHAGHQQFRVPVKVLSQRVGHADVGVTLSVYAHVMPGDDEEAARRADQLLFSVTKP